VKISSGTAFAIDRRADDRAVRICFGGRVDHPDLRAALVRINQLLDEIPDDRFQHVA